MLVFVSSMKARAERVVERVKVVEGVRVLEF